MSTAIPHRTMVALRLAAVAIMGAVVALALAASPAQALTQTEAGTFKSGTHYVALDPAIPDSNVYVVYDSDSKNKITSVKNSNTKITEVKKYPYSITIHLKKAGTTTIKYKYKGKTYTHTFIAKKYVNPAKTLKIGSKNYAGKFKAMNYYDLKKAQPGKKVVLKAKSGWKLKEVIINTYKNKQYIEKHKKASGFTLTKYDESMAVLWQHKKTGMVSCTYIALGINS